ncbi:6-phosphogluconolactonase [Sphingomonas sp. PP-F2F-G114-C0414]|uniref:lactonase family protein n=1 Tax=Sphingomonas sp. PP-F2F-G114-C0414 TaxID=2135662 RepID=UPI000EF8ED34|nr:lactonase family protein [Sphingomonas sp. PP-F2F-G114-C0414]RMB37042.1 6-phosphogluconolactonase [Sphingomonas sp. PP-F2F-G114-C0414]
MTSTRTAPELFATPESRSPELWIGTYAGGNGMGLYPLSIGVDHLSVGRADATAHNASFGFYSSRFDLHYIVDEQDDGAIGTYRRADDAWISLGTVDSGGAAPCHLALDATQSCLAVANYASGSTALYRLDPAGLPIAPPDIHANIGNGPNPERQTAPHAHWVGFGLDNRFLYVADLGADAVLAFAVDVKEGKLGTPHTAFTAPPGSGPRHMLFSAAHAQTAYLVCELSSTLVILDVDGADLRARAALSTLPEGWQGENIVAHIGANAVGDRLYVSNRGHDSIAVFALDPNGDATLVQHVASGGASPRFFRIFDDGRRMVVAHERDHRVTILDVRPDGTLAPTDLAVAVPGAAFAFIS